LTYIPAAFLLWPMRRAPGHAAPNGTAEAGASSAHGHDLWAPLTRLLDRSHWLVVGGAVGLMIVLGMGIAPLQTSVRIDTLFPRESGVLRDYAWLEKNIGSLVPLEVIVRCDENCRLSFADRLRLVRQLEDEARNVEGVGGTLSPLTFLPQFPARPDLPPQMYQ